MDTGEWVEGYLICYSKLWKIKATESDRIEMLGEWIVEPATVGQCTGIRDITGKVIFEGDIFADDIAGLGVVVFGYGSFSLQYIKKPSEDWNSTLLCVLIDDKDMIPFEIVGNIYDTPEKAGGMGK